MPKQPNHPRHEFNAATKRRIAEDVCYQCCNPDCTRPTLAATHDGDATINVGVFAHITAAAPGGPRYNADLSREQRSAASNGLLLCQICAKAVDDDEPHYTAELLTQWKQAAQTRLRDVIIAGGRPPEPLLVTIELDEADRALLKSLALPEEEDLEQVKTKVGAAARLNLNTFKSGSFWPQCPIPLNLRTAATGGDKGLDVGRLAELLDLHETALLVAGPGAGKTTTMIQLGDALLDLGERIPILVSLMDWAVRDDRILASLSSRQAFGPFREQHFMLLAFHGCLCLLLDGWNELGAEARKRLLSDLETMRREFPRLRVVLTTRRQATACPVRGLEVRVEALGRAQQVGIARALHGQAGVIFLEKAWRTPGVSELISVPLYFDAMLANFDSADLPSTKEEVLRLFVRQHERSPLRAAVLTQELEGMQAEVLEALAVDATNSGTTYLTEHRARKIVSEVGEALVRDGQLSAWPQPQKVLDALTGYHLLTHRDAVSFHHQQFQEWYASFYVERVMRAAAGDRLSADRLREMLNLPAWEEAILFACDRGSRADPQGTQAVAQAVRFALEIDPLLAAEMIYRSDEKTWQLLKTEVLDFVEKWKARGGEDRPLRFMISSGRPEFSGQLWPLVAHPDNQRSMHTFRTGVYFRLAVVGPSLEQLAGYPAEIRELMISELASFCAAHDLATVRDLAASDPSPKVQTAAVHAFQFRGAGALAESILRSAPDEVWTLYERSDWVTRLNDEALSARLHAEHLKHLETEKDPGVKLSLLLEGDVLGPVTGQKIKSLLMLGGFGSEAPSYLALRRALHLYQTEVLEALAYHAQQGKELFPGAYAILKGKVSFDEGPIVERVLGSDPSSGKISEEVELVGPKTIGALIDRLLVPVEGKTYGDNHRHWALVDQIGMSATQAFFSAMLKKAEVKDPAQIEQLAGLIGRHGKQGPIEVDSNTRVALIRMIKQWGEALLANLKTTRAELASLPFAVVRLPDTELFDVLRRSWDEDDRKWLEARARVSSRRTGGGMDPEMIMGWGTQYADAFAAMGGDDVLELMEKALPNPRQGLSAATVIQRLEQHRRSPSAEKQSRPVAEGNIGILRAQFSSTRGDPEFSGRIFRVIDQISAGTPSDELSMHAIVLGVLALFMPQKDESATVHRLLQLKSSVWQKVGLYTAVVAAGHPLSFDLVLTGLKEALSRSSGDQVPPDNLVDRFLALRAC